MSSKVFTWIGSLILVTALAVPGFAQINRGIIEGIVSDPTGAFVPGVKVIVTATDTNVTLPTTTNSAGYFRVTSLVPGKYQVNFEASGFAPISMKNIDVPAGLTIRADAQLQLGATRQTVEVSASATQAQTSATDFSTTLGTSAIEQLPLAGRDLQQLVLMVPGVVGNGPPGSNFGFNSQFGSFPDPTHMTGSDVSVNGGQTGTNAWYMDGNFNLSGLAESAVVNPTPDAVQEFQVVTSGFSAEYGRSGGAVFSVVLKSGTNKLHGNIYEYVRNSMFNARNPFTSIDSAGNIIPQNQMRFNNFGGTLGGPVYIPHLYDGRNKTFFFFSWDETILHLSGSGTWSVPTAKMRAGDFSEDPDAAQYGIWDGFTSLGPATDGTFARSALGTPVAGIGCTGAIVSDGAGGTTAQNPTSADCNFATSVPANRISDVSAFFMQSFPTPNYLDPLSNCPLATGGATRTCNNYLAGIGSGQESSNISLKIDHQISDKNRFFAEWLFNPGRYDNYKLPWTGATFPDGSFGYGGQKAYDFRNQIIALGNTYTFTPTLVNEFRASFTRQYYTTHPELGGYPDSVTNLSGVKAVLDPLQIPAVTTPAFNVSIPGGGSLGWGPIAWTNNLNAHESYTILDNITKIVGKHTLRTGFVYRLSHSAMFQTPPAHLDFNGFSNPITGQGGGGGIAQFLMGAVRNDGSAYRGYAWVPYTRYRYWGAYLQDDFRITPNFTLNLGLRYDINGAYKTRQHPNSRICLKCIDPLSGLPGIVEYEGNSPGFPMNSDVRPPSFTNFGPRINFSWTPFADRKTVVRGGYNVFYSNAFASINSAQTVENAPGYAYDSYFFNSLNPAQCADFTNECVAFSLDSSSTYAKGPLMTPPHEEGGYPAQRFDPMYTANPGGIADYGDRDPMVQNWTLQVQRELPGNMLLTVGYVGSHGTHLVGDMWYDFNYVHTADRLKYRNTLSAQVPITDYYSGQAADALEQVWGSPTRPRSRLVRPYPMYGSLGTTQRFNGDSIYHALQVRLQRRFSQGFSFDTAYTWSKNIAGPQNSSLIATVIDPIHFGRNGNVGGRTGASFWGAVGYGGYGSYQDPDNVKADRSLGFNDIPQIFNFSSTYELPFGASRKFANHKGVLNQIIGGWNLTGNFHAERGVPISIDGPCNALTCRPNLIGDPSAVSGGQNQDQWINPAAFEPPYGSDEAFWANPDIDDDRWWQFGTAGLRLPGLRTPGYWNLDASVAKRFTISESKYFEFRWEAFNTLNHQNLGTPSTGFCLPPRADGSTDTVHQSGCSFGRITNVQTDPRTLAFALKFYW